MEYSFSKDKLPKAASFPLKRSLLDKALEEAEISIIYAVSYNRGSLPHEWKKSSKSEIFLSAWYIGLGRTLPTAGKASITLDSVPLAERKKIEEDILTLCLPKLVEWLKKLQDAETGSTFAASNRWFWCEYVGEELRVHAGRDEAPPLRPRRKN